MGSNCSVQAVVKSATQAINSLTVMQLASAKRGSRLGSPQPTKYSSPRPSPPPSAGSSSSIESFVNSIRITPADEGETKDCRPGLVVRQESLESLLSVEAVM